MTIVRDIRPAGSSDLVTLRNGSQVQLRVLRDRDEAALRAFLAGVTPESLRRRFCGATDLARTATSLVSGCGAGDLALIAETGVTAEIVAHAASFRLGATRAEVAFLVTDEWQGRGLGSLLLTRLTEYAQFEGITTLVAEVLPGNPAMIAVFERCGHRVEVRWDTHGVQVEIDLATRVPAVARAA